MDVVFEARTMTLVLWELLIPTVNGFVQSKSFKIAGFNWYWRLTTTYAEYWQMSLHSDNKTGSLFLIKIYIRNGGKDIYLSQAEIDSSGIVIWQSWKSDFLKKYPNIQTDKTILQFVLEFSEPVILRPKKENNLPCLENLSLDLRKLVDDGSDPDVQLKCGEFSMGAHKLILGARSEVFRNMMKSDMKEGREDSVEIIDMEPKILEVFIRYIYTGILPELAENTALPLYEAADKYQVEALKKRCAKFLAQNASQENALRILATADAHCDTDLKENKSVQTTNTNTCAEEHVCLENLSLDLRKLVEDDSEPDVQLKCGDFSMGEHKLILGARSEVFRNMMKSGMKEGREDCVEIIDMEPKILEVFIRYIYTGILPELAENTALPLYEAADKYQVEALKKRSGKFLAQNVSQENALRILATADAHCDTDLKGSLISYIVLEKILDRETEWLEFCNEYPRLAIEVLNRCYKLSSSSQ